MTDDRIIQKVIDHARVVAADNVESSIGYILYDFSDLCESPIERIMLAAIYAELSAMNPGDYIPVVTTEHMSALIKDGPERMKRGWWLVPQFEVSDYRVDFGIFRDCRLLVVVECDGHEFHERTKEQALRDRSRDRALQAQGYCVFRFTGREIWRDPVASAKEAVSEAERRWKRALTEAMKHL